MKYLDLNDIRGLEDLIIDCIYNDLIGGKLDQKNQLLEVEYTFGRDLRESDIDLLVNKLEEWDQ